MRTVVIGTRGSPLALAQSGQIRALLTRRWPDVDFRLQTIKTGGDAWALQPPTDAPSGKGLFTREIEEALRAGTIDLAIHSLKDLPTVDPSGEGLVLAAIPERGDARDVLVVNPATTSDSYWRNGQGNAPAEPIIATGSLRRSTQLLLKWPQVRTVAIRGNIDTRLRKLRENPAWHGLVLAAAGLDRLGPSLEGLTAIPLPLETMLPAPGQGALALQCRAADAGTRELLAALDHAPTRDAVTAERAFLTALGGGCLSPVGAYASATDTVLTLQGIAWLGDSPDPVSGIAVGTIDAPEELGRKLARQLLSPSP